MSAPIKAISIDLGGSHATVGIVEDRKLLATRDIELDSLHGLGPALPLFKTAALELLQELSLDRRMLSGATLSFCGLADFRSKRVVSTNQKYDDATSLDL